MDPCRMALTPPSIVFGHVFCFSQGLPCTGETFLASDTHESLGTRTVTGLGNPWHVVFPMPVHLN